MISPHGHVDPQLLVDDEPFRDPASLFVTPDHYVTRLLHAERGFAARRSASAPGRSPRPARARPGALLCEHWDRLPRHARPLLARGRAGGDLRRDRAPVGADGRRDLRPRRRAARAGRLPAARALRALPASPSSPRPTTRATTSPRTRRSPPTRPGPGGSSRRSGPTATSSRPSPAGATRSRRSARSSDVDTGDYAGFVARARGAPAVLHRARRDLGRPQPRRRAHRPARRPRRRARIYRAALAGEATAAEAVAFRRHMLLEMARMSCEDGLVMTLHPGVRRGHHGPTAAAFGPDTGHDIPLARRVHRRAAPAARALRHASRASTWSSSRSTRRCGRASSRRWPASTRRCSSARRGGSSTRRRRSGASARR